MSADENMIVVRDALTFHSQPCVSHKWLSLLLAPVSDLVEGENINRLDHVVEGLDQLLHIIGRNLVVFNSCTNDKFEDTEGDGFLFVLLFPQEAVHADVVENALAEVVKVRLIIEGLYFPKDH